MKMQPSVDLAERRFQSRTFNFLAASLVILLACPCLHAQVKVLRIDPQQTDPAIDEVEGPQLALYDPHSASNHLLFVFLPGTRSKPESTLPIDTSFAQWGYHAISLDYENGVLTVAARTAPTAPASITTAKPSSPELRSAKRSRWIPPTPS